MPGPVNVNVDAVRVARIHGLAESRCQCVTDVHTGAPLAGTVVVTVGTGAVVVVKVHE